MLPVLFAAGLSFGFAQELHTGHTLELYGGVFTSIGEPLEQGGYEYKPAPMPSFGLGYINYSERLPALGFAMFADLRFPLGLFAVPDTEPFADDYHAGNSSDGIIGADISPGVICRLLFSRNFQMSVFAGPHFSYLSASKEAAGFIRASLTKFNMGLGVSGSLNYNISNKIYMLLRANAIIDIMNFATILHRTPIYSGGELTGTYPEEFKTAVPAATVSASVFLGIGIKI